MEANCHMFLINLEYRFLRFDIPSISLDILDISFPMSLSLSEKPGITIANVFKKNVLGISQKKLGLTKKLPACSPFLYYITGIC